MKFQAGNKLVLLNCYSLGKELEVKKWIVYCLAEKAKTHIGLKLQEQEEEKKLINVRKFRPHFFPDTIWPS